MFRESCAAFLCNCSWMMRCGCCIWVWMLLTPVQCILISGHQTWQLLCIPESLLNICHQVDMLLPHLFNYILSSGLSVQNFSTVTCYSTCHVRHAAIVYRKPLYYSCWNIYTVEYFFQNVYLFISESSLLCCLIISHCMVDWTRLFFFSEIFFSYQIGYCLVYILIF